MPAKFYKEQTKRPNDLYVDALSSDPVVSRLIRNAAREDKLNTTKDWSFIAQRLAGKNWFLAGESAGFADPILAAGLALTHAGARMVAYTILELERGEFEPDWLRDHYCVNHRSQIRQHVRFADFWYTANGVFSDLKEYARLIAEDAGLSLTADGAWRWLGQGGFIEHTSGTNQGGCGLLVTKEIIGSFTGEAAPYDVFGKTHFRTDLEGSDKDWMAEMRGGRITRRRLYRRNGKVLPMIGLTGWLAQLLRVEHSYADLCRIQAPALTMNGAPVNQDQMEAEVLKTLEAMVADGWIATRTETDAEPFPSLKIDLSGAVHPNRDSVALQEAH